MATKAKAKANSNGKAKKPIPAPEVMTLAEVAVFLRVTEGAMRTVAEAGLLPGRSLAGEWRFGRHAVLEWLDGSSRKTQKRRIAEIIGAWKNDPAIDDLIARIEQPPSPSREGAT